MVEHLAFNQRVEGSSPSDLTRLRPQKKPQAVDCPPKPLGEGRALANKIQR
jgi:hypothetical protein